MKKCNYCNEVKEKVDYTCGYPSFAICQECWDKSLKQHKIIYTRSTPTPEPKINGKR